MPLDEPVPTAFALADVSVSQKLFVQAALTLFPMKPPMLDVLFVPAIPFAPGMGEPPPLPAAPPLPSVPP